MIKLTKSDSDTSMRSSVAESDTASMHVDDQYEMKIKT